MIAGGLTAWFQPTYKNLLEVWRTMKLVLKPAIVSVSEQDKRIELSSGGVVEFWSLDRDPEGCRGRKYKRIVVNEAAKCKHLQTAWQLAIRPTLTDYRGDAFFPSTPRGRDFYYDLFQMGQPDTEKSNPSWYSVQMPTTKNPHIDPEEIKEAERDLPSTIFRQEYLAEFLDVAGRFFDEWEPSREYTSYDEAARKPITIREPWHVQLPYRIPSHYKNYGGLDWGQFAPFSFHLGAVSELGQLLIVDEVYERGLTPDEQAQKVHDCLERNHVAKDSRGRFTCLIAADPSMFPPKDPKQRVGQYHIEPFWKKGLKCIPALNNHLITNTNALKRIHDSITVIGKDGLEDSIPALVVFEGRCPNLIRTIPLMIRDDKKPEDFEDGLEDHAVDSGLRYLGGSLRHMAAKEAAEVKETLIPDSRLPRELRSDPTGRDQPFE